MKRDEALARLKQSESELKKAGVKHLYLFGSTVNDEARPDSDVDLFFDHDPGTLGLYELLDTKEMATAILGARTDIIPRDGLHYIVRERIEASAVQIF